MKPRPVSHSAQNSRTRGFFVHLGLDARAPPQSLRSWERCSGPRGGALSLPCPQGPPGPRPAAQPLLLASTHPKPPKPPRPPASAPAHPPTCAGANLGLSAGGGPTPAPQVPRLLTGVPQDAGRGCLLSTTLTDAAQGARGGPSVTGHSPRTAEPTCRRHHCSFTTPWPTHPGATRCGPGAGVWSCEGCLPRPPPASPWGTA